MNYRHGYHAGNFADVLKHVVLALVIDYMKRKPSPFRVIDTHAGAGLYALDGDQAQRTGEWRSGIGRVYGAKLPADVSTALAPYISTVSASNPEGELVRYPGSPLIAARLLRQDDRLIAIELQDDEHAALRRNLAPFRNAKVLQLDGYVALKANLPPKERRGIVIVDPPFEKPGEFPRLVEAAETVSKRFASATVLLWYPVKDEKEVQRFRNSLTRVWPREILFAELRVAEVDRDAPVSATGVAILNPTFGLRESLAHALPALCALMRRGGSASHSLHAAKA